MSLEADGSLGRGKPLPSRSRFCTSRNLKILQEAAGLVERSLPLEVDLGLTLVLSLTCCVNPWYVSHSHGASASPSGKYLSCLVSETGSLSSCPSNWACPGLPSPQEGWNSGLRNPQFYPDSGQGFESGRLQAPESEILKMIEVVIFRLLSWEGTWLQARAAWTLPAAPPALPATVRMGSEAGLGWGWGAPTTMSPSGALAGRF